jgi:prolyl-tRNA synthetase
MPVVADGQVVLALVRGDDRLDEAKLAATLGADVRPAQVEEIRDAFGADPGSLGPVGFVGLVLLDETLREGQFVAGANRTGFHLRGVEHGRDFEARVADIRVAREGDRCPKCGGALTFRTAIEVGHIFKLGSHYSIPLDATFLDEQSVERPLVMGCYGIGPGRVLAALVEQRHDHRGIVWPKAVTPYDVHVLALTGGSAEVEALAVSVAEELSAAGKDVLLDDRDARPGEKFADSDLLGTPLRVTVGKKSLDDGAVDVRSRVDEADTRVDRASVIDWAGKD